MIQLIARIFCLCLLIAVLASAGAVLALPSNVSVTPPNGARFFAGQRFDLRVEGKGAGPFSSTLKIDGLGQAFTSGVQNTTTTDGISSPGWGGFNLRGYSNSSSGVHTIVATFSDATGTVTVTTSFRVIELPADSHDGDRDNTGGEGKRVRNIII